MAGSLVLGTLAAVSSARGGVGRRTMLLAGVGFCGSFTTFSTFSVEFNRYLLNSEIAKASTYFVANNIGSIVAAGIPMYVIRKVK